MTDLEITRLCAEAMGYTVEIASRPKLKRHLKPLPKAVWGIGKYDRLLYDPLHDDAQAMALVKKLGLDIQQFYWDDPLVSKHDAQGELLGEARNADLNSAICECVAKMQAAT